MVPSGCPLLPKKNTGTFERTAMQKANAITGTNHLPKAVSDWDQMRNISLCKWSEWSYENSRTRFCVAMSPAIADPGTLGIPALPSLLEYQLLRGFFILNFASYTMYSLAPTQHVVETKQMLVEWAIRMLLVLSGTVWVKFPATPENQVQSPVCWGVSGPLWTEGPGEALPLSFHDLSESGQEGGDMTRAHLEVTFKIMTFGDTGAGRLRAEGGQMVLSHPLG